MTKLNSSRKNDKKALKRQKNEKFYLFQDEESGECINVGKASKSRVPSRQQYKRLKNKCFIQNFISKKPTVINIVKNQNSNGQVDLTPRFSLKINTPRLSECSDDFFSSQPHSENSFHIQPDWSDFEDKENFQFISELDVDLSKIFKNFEDKEITDFGVFDDLCLTRDSSENNLSCWAADLSLHRYDHAISTVSFIENIIKSNYMSIFTLDFKPKIWSSNLGDANRLLIFCESNKYLFQDLMTKEYSISMQNNCLKWTELGTRCSLIKVCLENIVHFNEAKSNLDTTLCVLYEQCISIINHGLVYPDPLVIRIIDGIKKILLGLKMQYNRIKLLLDDLFDLSERCSMTILDKIVQDISILEKGEDSDLQLKSIVESMAMYLGKEMNWIEEPVHQSSVHDMETLKSFSGVMQKQNLDSSFKNFHFKLIFVFFMSIMILFGSSDVDFINILTESTIDSSIVEEGSMESLVFNRSRFNITNVNF